MNGHRSPAASRGESTGGTLRPLDPWAALAPDLFGSGLELVAMSPGAWRLCDGSEAPDDARSVIAYLERDADGIDVVWLQGPCGQAHFASLEEAIAAADGQRPRHTSAGPTRPVPIAHRAPRAS